MAKRDVLYVLVFILLALFILYMLFQISPILANVFKFMKTVLLPFVVALVISYILNPIVTVLHKRKMPRTFAVLLIYTVFAAIITVVMLNLVPMLVKQTKELKEHYPRMTIQAQQWTEELQDNRFLPPSIRAGMKRSLQKAEQLISTAIANAINGIGETINMIFMAFIIPFLTFYMMKDFQLIEKAALAIVPPKHRGRTVELLEQVDRTLGNYIRGQLLVCLITGSLAYLGYWLIGLPYPLLLASFVAVFNIIPFIGPFLGAIPAILMGSTVSLKMALIVIGVNVVVQLLENNVVSPQVVGRTLQLHPLIVIFALLVGGELAGIVGLILAVPVFAVMKVIVQHFTSRA